MRTRWKTATAVGITAALALAACGSDSKSSSTTAAGTSPAAPSTTAGGATTAGAATTTGGAATTAKAPAGSTPASTPAGSASATTAAGGATGSTVSPKDIGLIDGVYQGTGGFTIDPADCPEDWDPKQGITDTEIHLMTSLPTSGPIAGFGLVAVGAQAYYKYINDNGGIDGRNIVLDIKDDAYQPDKTKTNVDEALGSNQYAAFSGIIGTPNNLAVWDAINDECMPQLLNGSGAAQWGDVENHPWTTGMQLDYFTEASLWATWLKTQHPDAKTVAEITYNSDFGQSYHNGFAYAIKGSDIKVVDQETHEATAPNLTNQFTTLATSDADVLLIETTGAFCTQAMAEVEKQTAWRPIVIMGGACASLNQFFQPLIDQGLTGKDTYLIQTYLDTNDPANQGNEFIQLYRKVMTEEGLDPNTTTYATGWLFGWFMVNILQNAATYQGGLDRGNIMLAARNINGVNPLLHEGLTSITNGAEDAYVTEGGQMVKYTITDPKQLGTYVAAGDLINLEGQLGTYKTVQDAVVSTGGTATTVAPTTTS